MEATFEPLPFDVVAARSYGQLVAAVADIGRSTRRRVADRLIAAAAHADGLALCTRAPEDLTALQTLVEIIAV